MLFELKDTIITSPEFHYPKMNEWGVFSKTITRPADYEDLDAWIKDTPEAIAIISAIKTDIIGDNIYFEPVDEDEGKKITKGKAKNSIFSAQDFYEKTFFKEELGKAILDWLIYGDAYLWKGKNKNEQLVPIYNKAVAIAKELIADTAPEDIPKIEESFDEDWTLKTIRHMPANTMNIDHDRYRITQFRQAVLGQSETFSVDEVIHAKLMTLRGKVYGYSPMIGSLPEIQTIGYIKNYAKNFFKYGGVPDWLFILPEEQVGSPNYLRFVEALQKYSHPLTNRGHMVLTGNIEREQLNRLNKDMEFRLLAIYLTGVLAMAFGMPVARIMQVVGGEVKERGGGADISNDAYWRSISEKQDFWEILLNTQLWRPYFKVNMRFSKSYKQDEVREAQIMQMKWQTVTQMLTKEFPVKDEWYYNFLDIDRKYLTGEEIKKGIQEIPLPFGKPLPNKEVQKGVGQQQEAREKRNEAPEEQDKFKYP